MEDKVNDQLESALDNNEYDESQLISIKIPVSYLPYYNNSPTFERVNGQVEIQGQEYKYVKRRIYNDSLELLCIAHPAITKIRAANNEFFRFLNDLQHNGNENAGHTRHGISKNFSVDFYTLINPLQLNEIGAYRAPFHTHYFIRSSTRHQLMVEQPPEIA